MGSALGSGKRSPHYSAGSMSLYKPLLLLWDDLSAHWTAEVKACADELKVVLVPVPPACTHVRQPADISWNMPLKARLRARWLENLQYQLRQPRAAGGLSREVIQSGFSFIFKPAHPSNAPAPTATPLAGLQTSTAVANELLALGQLDRVLGEVQEPSPPMGAPYTPWVITPRLTADTEMLPVFLPNATGPITDGWAGKTARLLSLFVLHPTPDWV
ncbi:hypothetical protein PC117_g21428 [Phytophthora cactorum]|uniref:DDE-1 domain-containing protein n=1 Tax=Phytophthora cactorum TaxID=29920 RepID=A0A8T1BL69_9STRA|nr:hypothetical protein PC117_g21428 [Phytophthora cactorum]